MIAGQVVVELVGGPNDGHTIALRPEEVTGRLVFEERRRDSDAMKRLLAGERVLADEVERPHVIDHVYSRTGKTTREGALLYRYVRPR